MIRGAGTEMVAAAALIGVPGWPVRGVGGRGAALGIAGHQAVELWLRRKGSNLLKGKGKYDSE
ncbi:hypothetical protein ACUNGW_23985 [Serratia sp. IR-2025]